jgi:hypothetical protein
MSGGFKKESENNVRVTLNMDEIRKLTKRYKKIKKYMKSPIYDLKQMAGTERLVSELLNDLKQNPEEG